MYILFWAGYWDHDVNVPVLQKTSSVCSQVLTNQFLFTQNLLNNGYTTDITEEALPCQNTTSR